MSIDYIIAHSESEIDAIICYTEPIKLKAGYYGMYLEINSDNTMNYSGGFIGIYEQDSNQIICFEKVWR